MLIKGIIRFIIVSTCIVVFITLMPVYVLAYSSACNVVTTNSPFGAAIEGELIFATVPNSISSITVDVTTSPNSTWKLYRDYDCTMEITNKQMEINAGNSNVAYIKVTAWDKTTKLYIIVVFREAISSVSDVVELALPKGAVIGVDIIKAKVPVSVNNVKINIRTSDYASWKLYSDANCTNEISNNQLSLSVGENIAYIKVTAQDKATTKKYTLTITRAAIADLNVSDVTQKVKILGQPFSAKGPYSSNVWDMQVYSNKIYLGFGNSSNQGPETNAGPIPVIYFNPSNGDFVNESITRYNFTTKSYETVKVIDEEQINIYRVLNGKLYIPGHDSRESWAWGNYYVMNNDGWKKYRNIPNGVHVYDMAYFQGKHFAAIGSHKNMGEDGTRAIVLMFDDEGMSWDEIGSIPSTPRVFDCRVYTLFVFKNKLYAVNLLHPAGVQYPVGYYDDITRILCFEQDANDAIIASVVDVHGSKMIPGVEFDRNRFWSGIMMARVTVVNDKLLFIAGQKYNDHQWRPGGLYVATDINSAEKICLPQQKAMPMDTLVRGNTAYVSAYVKKSNNEYTNLVYKSDDLVSWTELFRFQTDTFARSFEELNGDFYFGLGCYTDHLPQSTGTVLMVSSSAY